MLVEAYETENYPMLKSSQNEVLRHIMAVSNTGQDDLVGILGFNDVVSEIVNGTRVMSQAQAQILAQFFKVSPDLFVK